MEKPARRPGDQILDRYCPELSAEEREIAHERLRKFARVLIDIATRVAAERDADSRESRERGRIRPITDP